MSIETSSHQRHSIADSLGQLWLALCDLACTVRTWDQPIDYCAMRIGAHPATHINAPVASCDDCYTVILLVSPHGEAWEHDVPERGAVYRLDDLIPCQPCTSSPLPEVMQHLIRVYAPYCFASMHSKRWKRAFAVSHFAQSLDGRIATS